MSGSRPLVSIGIPTFNRPESLRHAIGCISGQTYANLEIIISDNASPGTETKRVVEECMACDSRVRYVRQTAVIGPFENFHFVLNAAKGEFFMWMADDDWRDPTFIESLLHELLTDGEAVLAFCDIVVFDECGNRREDFYRSYLPYLRKLTSDKQGIRLTRFFLQDEGLGKANLIYSLMRRSAITDVSLDSMLKRYGFYGLDSLIVFTLLEKGRLRLVEGALYGCTVGNIKHYVTSETSALKRRQQAIVGQIKYLLGYLRLTSGVIKLIFTILFPVKLVLFYWHAVRRKFVFP